ncbi:hypothetical protein G4G28_07965 [Massilia sp. Dwa41.01b]|nr:hypothetical protein G4G28_07965 [Massilia sp. Dwa41.01b]
MSASILAPDLLARARLQSRQSQRPLVAELEALTGLDPRQLVGALAEPLDSRSWKPPRC